MNRLSKRLPSAVLLAILSSAASAAAPPSEPAKAPAPPAAAAEAPASPAEQAKIFHALGVLMSTGIANFSLTEAEFAEVIAGITDGYHHVSDPTQAMTLRSKIEAEQHLRMQAAAKQEAAAGQAYLAKVEGTPGAQKTASGIVYVPITPGTGESPMADSQVKVNYTGKLVDGTVFDSSATHGGPATFGLRNVIPCFAESLQMMKVGGKTRIVCPANLAYGDRGSPPKIKPGSTLDFEIELLEIVPPPAGAKPKDD